jgi:1-phosphofructokinase family hexose kinase
MIYTITLNPALDREMTVKEISLNRVLRAGDIRIDYGGKGFNVSRALLALGLKSTAIGFIGGAVGDLLEGGLTKLGISCDFVRIEGETRTNYSVVDEDHRNYIKVNEAGPHIQESEVQALLQKIKLLARDGDWWIMSGSVPQGVPPGFITEIVHSLRSAGAYAIVDMEGQCLRDACFAGAYLVKPNAHEASELTGKEISSVAIAVDALYEIHQLGAKHVVITLGKDGAVYFDGSHTWVAIPPAIQEHNPIGAGDAMLAGMVWGLVRQLPEKEALRWGVACGAAAARLDGTAVGSYSEVEGLVNAVQIFEYGNG